MEKKKHAALFNGLGGFQIAADQVGWENVFSSEIDGFCNKVTGYHFPKCNQYGDIKTTDFNVWRGQIDVLSGGFPCQPYSHAGKRLGKDDDRYLWPETVRVIREIQPRVIVLENVAGLVSILEPESISKVETEALRLFSEGEQKKQTIKSVEISSPHNPHKINTYYKVGKGIAGADLDGNEYKQFPYMEAVRI